MSIHEVDSYELMQFAEAYAKLGWAVAEQLTHLLDGTASGENVNPNAVAEIKRHLGGMNEEIDNAIAAYYDERVDEEGECDHGPCETGAYSHAAGYQN